MAKKEWTAEERAEASRKAKERYAKRVAEAGDPAEPEVEVEEEVEEQFEAPSFAEGGVPVAEPDEPMPEAEMSPFAKWVISLDDETRDLLDDDDLIAIWQEQQAKAKAEKKAAAKKSAAAHALQTARIAEGVIAPASADEIAWKKRMEEPVEFIVEMPHVGEGVADIGLRIDQKIFLDGVRYTLPRAKYESMRYNLYLARQNELLFEGRDKRHWLRRQAIGTVDGRIN